MKNNTFKMYSLIISMMLITMLFMFSSCGSNNGNNDDTEPSSDLNSNIQTTNSYEFLEEDADNTAQNFNSDKEFTYFMSANSNNYYGGYGRMDYLKTDGMMVESVNMDMSESISASPSSQGVDYSTTNVQVENVDEGDIIKTDGEYICTISNKVLYIIKAYPGEDSKIVSTYEFKNYPMGLFINGDKLMVYENVDDYSTLDEPLTKKIMPGQSLTAVKLFDITDKKDIELVSEKIFEGYYQNSRMIEDVVYLVTDIYENYQPPIYYDGLVREVGVKNVFYYPMPYSNPHLVAVQSLDINTGDLIEQKMITTESGNQLYMSDNSIYLTTTKYINEWDIQKEIFKEIVKEYLTKDDDALIEKIQNTDADILSNYEKENKIYQVYSNALMRLSFDEREDVQDEATKKTDDKMAEFEYFTYTIINKIDVDDGKLDVSDYAQIPGRVNNQFSMDEYDNVLRIATTIDQNWRLGKATESENHVYTLDADLEIMDSITGIAKTETIYSTRFVGKKMYMVTFRQVDPFFVFDLSNPSNIKELGQLKIPGFSRYLHPYDENYLIGIGRDATESGRQEGLKISLFDVTDPKNPIEVAKYVTESKYASSNAEYEHKAFLFSKDKELLVIPAYSYDYDTQKGYNGAFVFKINKKEITLRGLIDHSNKQSPYYYGSSVERSLYIEEELYTKSLGLLRINSLDDLSSIKNITLETKNSDIPIY